MQTVWLFGLIIVLMSICSLIFTAKARKRIPLMIALLGVGLLMMRIARFFMGYWRWR